MSIYNKLPKYTDQSHPSNVIAPIIYIDGEEQWYAFTATNPFGNIALSNFIYSSNTAIHAINEMKRIIYEEL